eukprot:gene11648-14266_t
MRPTNSLESQTMIAITFNHFKKSAILDPDFAILKEYQHSEIKDYSLCSGKKKESGPSASKLAGIIIGAILGVVVVIFIISIIISRRRGGDLFKNEKTQYVSNQYYAQSDQCLNYRFNKLISFTNSNPSKKNPTIQLTSATQFEYTTLFQNTTNAFITFSLNTSIGATSFTYTISDISGDGGSLSLTEMFECFGLPSLDSIKDGIQYFNSNGYELSSYNHIFRTTVVLPKFSFSKIITGLKGDSMNNNYRCTFNQDPSSLYTFDINCVGFSSILMENNINFQFTGSSSNTLYRQFSSNFIHPGQSTNENLSKIYFPPINTVVKKYPNLTYKSLTIARIVHNPWIGLISNESLVLNDKQNYLLPIYGTPNDTTYLIVNDFGQDNVSISTKIDLVYQTQPLVSNITGQDFDLNITIYSESQQMMVRKDKTPVPYMFFSMLTTNNYFLGHDYIETMGTLNDIPQFPYGIVGNLKEYKFVVSKYLSKFSPNPISFTYQIGPKNFYGQISSSPLDTDTILPFIESVKLLKFKNGKILISVHAGDDKA